jgi:cytochrome oxidase assembly protein ShyY1
MADYRFARRPKWILGHLLALGLIVLMVNLGFWQLRRLDQRRALNAEIVAHQELAPAPVGDLADPDTSGDDLDALRFRPVTAAGTYDDARDRTIAVRVTQQGAPGQDVVSVLALDGGDELVPVLRGFEQTGDPEPAPSGPVEVSGLTVPVERLDRLVRTSIERLDLPADRTLPVAVVLESSDPAEPALLPVPRPSLDEGPHLGYAVQWFLFSTVGAVGYPLLLRRRARDAPEDDGTP